MAAEKLSLVDSLGSFAPGQPLRAVLVLTYCFDGRWFEEAVAPEVFERPVATALLIRDRNALISELPSVRFRRADAAFSTRVFHPKLALFVAEDRARVFLGSANLTRGGYERNLELGSVYDIDAGGGFRSLFSDLHAYIDGPLGREVDGNGRLALQEVAVALAEVIRSAPAEPGDSPHVLLHNYTRPLWEQVLERLPHRTLRRAVVVSPFFEPDGAADDPPGQADDSSAFSRLLTDFAFEPERGEEPISVYFHEDFGATALPVAKLFAWKDRLKLFARSHTSDDARRLHAKMLVLEGAGGSGRKPFLFALHGSPNFSSAALLTTPPDGNAELAVLTELPHRGGGITKVTAALGLSDLFGPIIDWAGLRSQNAVPPVRRPADHFAVTDATLHVATQVLTLSFRSVPVDGTNYRILVGSEGSWVVLGSGEWQPADSLAVRVEGLITEDPKTGLQTLIASRVRVEILGADGTTVLASDDAPLNVDCPQHFCGLAMVGPLLLSLDERIAQAGAGVPMTYREQQKWLERFRQHDPSVAGTRSDHQADLDRFFRNLHTGLKGLRRRLEQSPASEFALRNVLRQLAGWCAEAVAPESRISTAECRLFLLDRLAREIGGAISRVEAGSALAARLPAVAADLRLAEPIAAARSWLTASGPAAAAAYLRATGKAFDAIAKTLQGIGRPA